MHRSALVVLGVLVGTACCGTTIRIPLSGSPMTYGREQIDFDQDGITDFSLGGRAVCTYDIPTSTCAFSLIIEAREGVSFLLAAVGDRYPVPLKPGDVIGESPSTRSWGSVPYDSVWVSYTVGLLEPETSGYRAFLGDLDEYLIGFRAVTEDGTRFGWLDVSLYSSLPVPEGQPLRTIGWPQARALFFGSVPNESLVVTPIPEPSSLTLVVLSSLLLMGIRRPKRVAGSD